MANTTTLTHIKPQFKAFLTQLTNQPPDPVTFNEAVKDSTRCKTINQELQALEDDNTWEITDLPIGKRAIGSKRLYKTKYNSDGTINKNKARLVIQGYRQQQGIDFEETFAPVVKMTTVRALLAVAAMRGWHLCQMDVSNAFLLSNLYEEVYMTLPKVYTSQGERIHVIDKYDVKPTTKGPQQVCRLLKSPYGLKQAPRQWFAKLSYALVSFGFTQSKSDYSLFTMEQGSSFTVILVYVDDMVLTGNDLSMIQKIKHLPSQQFHMKDLGAVRYFLVGNYKM